MKIKLLEIDRHQWEERFAFDAHKAAFDELLPEDYGKIDFALLAVDENTDRPLAYLTAVERSDSYVYLRHGGAFASVRGQFMSANVYYRMIEHMRSKYEHVGTHVDNGNVVYLKLAMSAGFRVTGVRTFKDSVLLELYLKEDGYGTDCNGPLGRCRDRSS